MFKELKLKQIYVSDEDDIPRDFYNPTLMNAISYDRTSAYFSAKALALYSEGLEFFGNKGYTYRLIISHDISKEDYEEIKRGYKYKDSIKAELIDRLQEKLNTREEMRLSNLAYFIAKGTVEIKIAFKTQGIFHDKCGIMEDQNGNIICFRGSNNETEAAIQVNYETLQLTCSWLDSENFYLKGIQQSKDEFDALWNNEKEGLVVLPADEVIIKNILKYNKGKVIVEETLLEKDAVVLDYDRQQLILQCNTESIDWLTGKMFFKSRIKHKIERIANNIIYFKTDLVYSDYISINELLEKKIPVLGYKYAATRRLLDYIDERNLYIDKRAKLGIELKTDPRRIEDMYIEFRDVVSNSFDRKLREKQMKDAFFMCAMTKSGNFSVPGSGKTSSALAVFAYLKQRDLVQRVVMIGPKNAFGSWIDEFKMCFGEKLELNCFNIQDEKYNSTRLKREAIKYNSGNCNLFLFNYESIGNYVNELKQLVSSKTLLVFDEVHKVKAINGQRAMAALEIAKNAVYTIAMTGTPIPNSYLDLYNLLHILYNDEYREFFGFDVSYLRDPYPTDIEIINSKIQPFFCRTTKKELLVPEPNKDIIKKVAVSIQEQRLFEILAKQYRNNKLALFIRLLQLESNPKLLLQAIDLKDFMSVLDLEGDIDQIDFVDYALEVRELINQMTITSKKKACIELIKKLVEEKKKVIVWCIFVDSIRSIKAELGKIGISAEFIMGELKLEERLKIIDSFKNGEFDVLITNPHTLAESVSLHTVCHDAVYFEYSYNLVHLLQSKDRIHRLGLPDNQYTQYYYLQDWFTNSLGEDYSLDDEVYQRLVKKEFTMLNAIDNNELEPVYTPEEDLELIFAKLF